MVNLKITRFKIAPSIGIILKYLGSSSLLGLWMNPADLTCQLVTATCNSITILECSLRFHLIAIFIVFQKCAIMYHLCICSLHCIYMQSCLIFCLQYV